MIENAQQRAADAPEEPALDATAQASALLELTRRRVRHVVELAAAEAKLAAISGLAMLLLLAVLATSMVIAWGLVIVCLLYLSTLTPVPWPFAAAGLALLHAGLAVYCWHVATGLSRNLTLPALRQTLAGGDEDDTNEDHDVEP